MARNSKLIEERNTKIVAHFNELCSKTTASGKTKYSYDYMLETLGGKFYLTTRTIHNILKEN